MLEFIGVVALVVVVGIFALPYIRKYLASRNIKLP